MDERALTVKDEALTEDKGLSVLVHNNSSRQQTALVQVVGLKELEDPGAQALLSDAPVKIELGAGKSAIADIPLGAGEPAATAGSYSLLLVASGNSGPVSHRELTIAVEAGAETPDRGAELAVDSAQDITVVAVNYLPSLLSGLSWLALTVGLLLGSAFLFVVWSAISPGMRLAIGICAAILVVTGVLLCAFNDDLSSGGSAHAISSRPVAVSPDSHQGTVGAPSSEGGELALLEVSEGEMRPQGLSHAGAYKGPYDLAPDPEGKGKGVATINVRDWWPYAFLTLALGVLVGYLLRRWYQRQRPRAKLELRRDRIVARIASEDDRFKKSAVGKPYAGLSIAQRIEAHLAKINRLIEEGDEKAGDAMTELESYLAKYSQLRESLRTLSVASERLKAQIAEQSFDIDSSMIQLGKDAEAALTPDIDSADLDSEAATIKAALTAASTAHSLIERALVVHASIAANLKRAEEALRKSQAGDKQVKLLALVKAFGGLGQRLLLANSLASVETIATEDGTKFLELNALDTGGAGDAIEMIGSRSAIAASYMALAVAPSLLASRLQIDGLEAAEPTIEVTYEVLGVPEGSRGVVHREDEVRVRVAVSSGRDLDFTGVEVDFDDGSPPDRLTLEIDSGPVEVSASRWMTVDGDRTIRVRKTPGGGEVASIPISVDPSPRLAVHEADLERKERLMGRMAFVLAVGSGLATLYFADAAWGEPVDYLKAALWGGVTAEGIKLAAALADRTWPAE